MFLKSVMVALVAIMSCFIGIALAATPGQKVGYDRGKTMHLEFRIIEESPKAIEILSSRMGTNPDTGAPYKNPMSAGDPLSRAAKDGAAGVSFVPCTLPVDIEVHGLQVTPDDARRDFELLAINQALVGTMKASKVGPTTNWVRFEDVKIVRGSTGLVLPLRFTGPAPTVRVYPRGWNAVGPFQQEGVYAYNIAHRVYPGNDPNGVNTAVRIPMIAKGGTCQGPQRS